MAFVIGACWTLGRKATTTEQRKSYSRILNGGLVSKAVVDVRFALFGP
jgi:hypothetical protein